MKHLFTYICVALSLVACDEDLLEFNYMTPSQIDSQALIEDLCTGVLSIKDADWDNVLLFTNGKWKPLNKEQDGIGIPTYIFFPNNKLWYCYKAPSSHITGYWSYDTNTATLYTTEQNNAHANMTMSMRVAAYNTQTGEIDLEGNIVYYNPFKSEYLRLRCELRATDREQSIQQFSQPHPYYDHDTQAE